MEIHQLKIRSEFFHAVKIGRKKRSSGATIEIFRLVILFACGKSAQMKSQLSKSWKRVSRMLLTWLNGRRAM